jgi:2-dehydropantoate 2-reductase
MIRHAGVPCDVSTDIERTHWQKLVWNIPFNGLGVAAAAGWDAVESGVVPSKAPIGPTVPTDQLLADRRWTTEVRQLMMETIATSNALDHEISPDYVEMEIERTIDMRSYRASTLIDFDMRRPLELESLFLFPQSEARRARVSTPHLDRLCNVLTTLADRLSIPWRVEARHHEEPESTSKLNA